MESTSRAESRFRYYTYYFYVGGVPLFNSNTSALYRIFVLFCYVCSYSTILAAAMAIYHNRDDFDNAISIVLLLLIFSSAVCVQLYFR
jgi:hypothetical protein